ncbi:MAG: prolipoprotein diacylglyceryl transferase family protein [Candidatus Pacearchaeota archaeon]|jgi:phosphatidylglycerol:prolipoprotein diacylglycerol transferase
MIDEHLIPGDDWGVYPYLFNFFGIKIPSYGTFMLLAIVVGSYIYYLEARKNKSANENTFYIALAAIVGGAIGAKLPIWILNYKFILANITNPMVILSGRTITGGLIGGMIGVFIAKKHLKLKERKGNLFAPAIALGVAIGRIGCFLRGCCYGKPTTLPWGVDFGDKILRHPTQIYESIFMLIMFFYLLYAKRQNPKPGELFRQLMISYFTFRFFIEFIRIEKVILFGLTFFQIFSLICVIYFVIFFNREKEIFRNCLKLIKKY